MDVTEETQDILPDGVRATLEAEHGPIVAIQFRAKVFAFKRCTRVEFDLRESRLSKGDEEASDRLLQERCVWPSREDWNALQDAMPLSVAMFWNAYAKAHGGATAYTEKTVEGYTGPVLTNGARDFMCRNVTRPEAKRFQSVANSDEPGAGFVRAVEGLLRACCPGIGPWLDDNLFALSPLGKAFLSTQGLDLEGGGLVAK